MCFCRCVSLPLEPEREDNHLRTSKTTLCKTPYDAGEQAKKFGSQTVFGRAAQPAELAPVFVFLASNESSYVSGAVYGATGGQTPI
ncbi:MAG: SDR family oxidoreductase [Verrucomicrobia bacterium]|nr:SDR family oxidoreductase [Verrucomicrobiota bacterium]